MMTKIEDIYLDLLSSKGGTRGWKLTSSIALVDNLKGLVTALKKPELDTDEISAKMAESFYEMLSFALTNDGLSTEVADKFERILEGLYEE